VIVLLSALVVNVAGAELVSASPETPAQDGVAEMTASSACTSFAINVQRRHEVHRRTWCSSRPGEGLGGLEGLLDTPADTGDADQLGQRIRPGE
jgi:hypothetical protein